MGVGVQVRLFQVQNSCRRHIDCGIGPREENLLSRVKKFDLDPECIGGPTPVFCNTVIHQTRASQQPCLEISSPWSGGRSCCVRVISIIRSRMYYYSWAKGDRLKRNSEWGRGGSLKN